LSTIVHATEVLASLGYGPRWSATQSARLKQYATRSRVGLEVDVSEDLSYQDEVMRLNVAKGIRSNGDDLLTVRAARLEVAASIGGFGQRVGSVDARGDLAAPDEGVDGLQVR
jgi:hypothetical protein